MPRLAHHLYDLVEAHTMAPIAERTIGICIQCTSSSEGITLNTRYLHQTTYWVTGQS